MLSYRVVSLSLSEKILLGFAAIVSVLKTYHLTWYYGLPLTFLQKNIHFLVSLGFFLIEIGSKPLDKLIFHPFLIVSAVINRLHGQPESYEKKCVRKLCLHSS